MSRCVIIDTCQQCPWLKWAAEPRCGNPETLDMHIPDPMDIPEWCVLDTMIDVEDE